MSSKFCLKSIVLLTGRNMHAETFLMSRPRG